MADGQDGKAGFEDIREALEGGACLYDRARGTLWQVDDGAGDRTGITLRADSVAESDIEARIESGEPLPVAKGTEASRLEGEWGRYATGGQPYGGMTAGERLVRICQLAAGNPGQWVLYGKKR